jgi:hypothetical protein
LLRPAPNDALRLWPVSRRVNRTGQVDDTGLIELVVEARLAASEHVRYASDRFGLLRRGK